VIRATNPLLENPLRKKGSYPAPCRGVAQDPTPNR
jgi:hypothetical protein